MFCFRQYLYLWLIQPESTAVNLIFKANMRQVKNWQPDQILTILPFRSDLKFLAKEECLKLVEIIIRLYIYDLKMYLN